MTIPNVGVSKSLACQRMTAGPHTYTETDCSVWRPASSKHRDWFILRRTAVKAEENKKTQENLNKNRDRTERHYVS